MKRIYTSLSLSVLLLSGCTNHQGVAPSQNSSLNAVSPSDTTQAQGGAMQRSLDGWLAEEWAPATTPKPTVQTVTQSDGTTVETKTEIVPTVATITTAEGKEVQTKAQTTQVITTTTASDGKVISSTTAIVETTPEPSNEEPFTLQKYADKWKVYHENKEKMNEGKPKEVSHVESMQSMPVIGK
jgi:hypothetical protein